MAEHNCDVSVANFEESVLASSWQVPVIVDFWAPWCQPCRIIKPILEKLAAEYGGKFILAKVNSDENQELAQRYGVRGIPAVKAFRDGQLVDEFTGALPEAQIREFLDRLIPSPAEPLHQEALAAYAGGDLDLARELMSKAIETDPRNETAYLDYVEMSIAAGVYDEASEVLEGMADKVRDQDRVAALRVRLQLAQVGGNADLDALRASLQEAPDDHTTRLQLANALALSQNYRGALDNLLELVRRDRKWNEEAGRRAMLNLFTLLAAQPQYDNLVREFRIALARTLN